MRKRNTEETLADLYLYLASKGLVPLPPKLPERRPRRRRYREGELMTPAQSARFLKVSVKTLANWRVKGCGPSFKKIGGSVVYDFTELKSFVTGRSRSSTSDKGAA
ncbi:DNA-binding protein [Mesorhizobium sp. M7A.F.Ca.US.002.01.1.1]|nr:DNA-binding protein [Mesorhizobium sp. M7A.F.Ca.US.002.01.1.1]